MNSEDYFNLLEIKKNNERKITTRWKENKTTWWRSCTWLCIWVGKIKFFFNWNKIKIHLNRYRGYDCRDNVFCLKTNEIVYHVAAIGIVLNTEQNVQRFYNYHTDDILCLAVSPDMSLVATGQVSFINKKYFS